MLTLSKKGQDLVRLYTTMANSGYDRADGSSVDVAFSDFESRRFRSHIKKIFDKHKIKTVLDYGCGGSDWNETGFDPNSGHSALKYYNIENAFRYEPARNIDERAASVADCVLSFDVLEHIFISDVPNVLRDMFSNAKKIVVLNVACYPASARLPNGENAHITVRPPLWWKGQVDSIASEFPSIEVYLGCSESYGKLGFFNVFGESIWQNSPTFVTNF